jgi:endonuclease/exonuclease/phosphatase family metal-dependent hydrolase
MKHTLSQFLCVLALSSSPLFGTVEDSILPLMDSIYAQDFGKKVNSQQKEAIQYARKNQDKKLRLMTYNMLYNAKDAEEKLPPKYRWDARRPRLLEYLLFAKADIIGSQELQEDQVQEVMQVLGSTYSYYGEKTRQNEGRSDVNAIFFNKNRFELLEAKTIAYDDPQSQNGFTYCRFKDKLQGNEFIVLNTKLTWGDVERRLAEATQLNRFSTSLPADLPVIITGDFNAYPFIQHKRNIFFDGDSILQVIAGKNLKDSRSPSTFGNFGPFCSITNAKDTLASFAGPQLTGFILDHIFVNKGVDVFTNGIDTAKVDGEFPSDHFPVIADVVFK